MQPLLLFFLGVAFSQCPAGYHVPPDCDFHVRDSSFEFSSDYRFVVGEFDVGTPFPPLKPEFSVFSSSLFPNAGALFQEYVKFFYDSSSDLLRFRAPFIAASSSSNSPLKPGDSLDVDLEVIMAFFSVPTGAPAPYSVLVGAPSAPIPLEVFIEASRRDYTRYHEYAEIVYRIKGLPVGTVPVVSFAVASSPPQVFGWLGSFLSGQVESSGRMRIPTSALVEGDYRIVGSGQTAMGEPFSLGPVDFTFHDFDFGVPSPLLLAELHGEPPPSITAVSMFGFVSPRLRVVGEDAGPVPVPTTSMHDRRNADLFSSGPDPFLMTFPSAPVDIPNSMYSVPSPDCPASPSDCFFDTGIPIQPGPSFHSPLFPNHPMFYSWRDPEFSPLGSTSGVRRLPAVPPQPFSPGNPNLKLPYPYLQLKTEAHRVTITEAVSGYVVSPNLGGDVCLSGQIVDNGFVVLPAPDMKTTMSGRFLWTNLIAGDPKLSSIFSSTHPPAFGTWPSFVRSRGTDGTGTIVCFQTDDWDGDPLYSPDTWYALEFCSSSDPITSCHIVAVQVRPPGNYDCEAQTIAQVFTGPGTEVNLAEAISCQDPGPLSSFVVHDPIGGSTVEGIGSDPKNVPYSCSVLGVHYVEFFDPDTISVPASVPVATATIHLFDPTRRPLMLRSLPPKCAPTSHVAGMLCQFQVIVAADGRLLLAESSFGDVTFEWSVNGISYGEHPMGSSTMFEYLFYAGGVVEAEVEVVVSFNASQEVASHRFDVSIPPAPLDLNCELLHVSRMYGRVICDGFDQLNYAAVYLEEGKEPYYLSESSPKSTMDVIFPRMPGVLMVLGLPPNGLGPSQIVHLADLSGVVLSDSEVEHLMNHSMNLFAVDALPLGETLSRFAQVLAHVRAWHYLAPEFLTAIEELLSRMIDDDEASPLLCRRPCLTVSEGSLRSFVIGEFGRISAENPSLLDRMNERTADLYADLLTQVVDRPSSCGGYVQPPFRILVDAPNAINSAILHAENLLVSENANPETYSKHFENLLDLLDLSANGRPVFERIESSQGEFVTASSMHLLPETVISATPYRPIALAEYENPLIGSLGVSLVSYNLALDASHSLLPPTVIETLVQHVVHFRAVSFVPSGGLHSTLFAVPDDPAEDILLAQTRIRFELESDEVPICLYSPDGIFPWDRETCSWIASRDQCDCRAGFGVVALQVSDPRFGVIANDIDISAYVGAIVASVVVVVFLVLLVIIALLVFWRCGLKQKIRLSPAAQAGVDMLNQSFRKAAQDQKDGFKRLATATVDGWKKNVEDVRKESKKVPIPAAVRRVATATRDGWKRNLEDLRILKAKKNWGFLKDATLPHDEEEEEGEVEEI